MTTDYFSYYCTMAAEAFESILLGIQARKFSPLYFFYGEEEFFIDKLTHQLENTVLSEAEKSFNQSVLYGKDITVQQLIETCRRLPMMSERQVVIVREAQTFTIRANEEDALLSYLKHPTASTILVMAYKYGKPDARKKVYKEWLAKATSFESKKLYENQVGAWITKQVTALGHRINADAAELLVEFTGNDLATISNELSKLVINRDPKDTISGNDIEKSVGMLKEFSVFELNNAIAYKQTAKAYRIANYFSANPKSAPMVMVVGTLFGFFTKVLITSANKGKQDKDLASLLKVNPFFVKDYKAAVQHYSSQKLEQIFYLLQEFDLRSKGVNSTNNSGEGELVRELVWKIMN